jgi:hypothetical protein
VSIPASAAPLATVALIAHGIIERKVKFGALDASDFTDYKVPGTNGQTFHRRTMADACREAWNLVQEAENARPK